MHKRSSLPSTQRDANPPSFFLHAYNFPPGVCVCDCDCVSPADEASRERSFASGGDEKDVSGHRPGQKKRMASLAKSRPSPCTRSNPSGRAVSLACLSPASRRRRGGH